MKIRQGFVSNSSSSSFVIYKPILTKTQIEGIKDWYDKNEEEMYDDSGVHYFDEDNYICLSCHSKSDEFLEFLNKINIKKEDVYMDYR